MRISELDTPVAIVDLERLEANIARLQSYLDAHGIANRPHIKTHKIPAIAQMQVKAGAIGVTCQKLGEAEVMADAGLSDIFLPYNILGPAKLQRLIALMRRVTLSVTVDSEVTARALSSAVSQSDAPAPLDVLVEFDTGMGRCGAQSPGEAADLARLIARLPGLRFGGLMTYPYNEHTQSFVEATRAWLKPEGLSVARVSAGGTPQMWRAHTCPAITEYRAGMYVYGDRYTLQSGAMTLDDCALKVITTVVSRPTVARGILDAGSKVFSSDTLGLDGYGLILEYPEARFYGQSEEHGHVDFSACARKPEIGERVTVIPNHCCPVSNLFDQMVGVRGDQVEGVWQIAARGRVQ